MTILDRNYKHLSLRYIYDRILVLFDESRNPENPWLTADAVKILETLLKKDDIGVEFGSGRSTVWFARKINRLVSIENDSDWFSAVTRSLEDERLTEKVDYRFQNDEDSYVDQATTFGDESIDFCLVDGESRDRCVYYMIKKIKHGGILVIDNVNWYLPNDVTNSPDSRRATDGCASDVWSEVLMVLSSWRYIWTTNGVTDTAIFIKP